MISATHILLVLAVALGFIAVLAPAQAAVKKLDPPSAFGLIMQANQNQARSRDGVELFQGDITMTEDIRDELRSMGLYPYSDRVHRSVSKMTSRRPKRAAISNKNKRWMGRDGRPYIPYRIERSVYHARGLIQRAIQHWRQKVSCLRFVPRTNQRAYISFYAGGGCFSNVGRVGSMQRVSIGRGCEHLSVIVHEIGHALGFWHEQSRPDRDRYVRIYWNRILPQFRFAFHKYADGRINSLGVPYDYTSVMHYNSRAFGQGRTTITRINGGTQLGNRRGLSTNDVKQARLLYCGSGIRPTTRPPRPPTRPPTGCRHVDKSKWCTYWASKGYCSPSSGIYYPHMSANCKKTCLCRTPPKCQDKRPSCGSWARSGYCRGAYVEYMRTYCKKSCKLCR